MFVLALLALALTKLLLFSKVTAEDNLYEATSLTVAISTIEQMQGASLNLLENPLQVSGASVGRHTDCNLLSLSRPRFTFSRISEALAVQMNGFGFSLCLARYSSMASSNSCKDLKTPRRS